MAKRGCGAGRHDFHAGFHRRTCVKCGYAERVRCGDGLWVVEPAGARNIVCGFFEPLPHATLTALWNQYRLDAGYCARDPIILAERHPPRWFARLVVGVRRD
ncbi:hypothetical protein K8I61_11185 [bacterium]|nr:hypothetical protein [bacterium]